MITAGELRRGVAIALDGRPLAILEYQHIKMGRGGALVRLRLRDLREGHITDRTFPASERFTRIRVELRPVQYLYTDGDLFHFMDTDTYDQIALSPAAVGEATKYLKEGMTLDLNVAAEEAIGIELPPNVELRVTESEPGLRGDTASGVTKPATLETGAVVQVPLFIGPGELIRVDTRTGNYLERVRE